MFLCNQSCYLHVRVSIYTRLDMAFCYSLFPQDMDIDLV